MQKYSNKLFFNQGFTLIELMLVLMVIALLAAIAMPSYQAYARRANATAAQQEMLKLADQLERHKSKNFSYKGFNPRYLYNASGVIPFNAGTQTLTLPLEATGAEIKYTLTIVDGDDSNLLLTNPTSLGQNWAIKAVSSDARNFSFLITNVGVRCRNTTSANITYSTCGSGAENW